VILIHELLFLSILKSSGSRTAVRLSAPLAGGFGDAVCCYTSENGHRKPSGARFPFHATKEIAGVKKNFYK